jgi:voltage-gated potassium channel Kch
MNSGAVEGRNNLMLEIARFALPGLAAITALEALAVIFREQTVWLRLWRKKGHVVVCGLGRKGSYLVEDLLANGYQVVAIEKDVNQVIAEDYQRRSAIILEGDATDPEMLENARITRAKYLICLLGEDAQNLQVAFHASHILQEKPQHKLTCFVHLVSQDLLEVVRASEQSNGGHAGIVLEVFNVYERLARQLVQDDPVLQTGPQRKPVSVLVCGLGSLGKSIVHQMAYTHHRQGSPGRIRLIILDREADIRLAELRSHFPGVDSAFQFQTIHIDLSNNRELKTQLAKLAKRQSIGEVFICPGNPVLGAQIFLVAQQVLKGRAIPIKIRTEANSGLIYLIENQTPEMESPQNAQFFDIYQQTCTHDLIMGGTHELLARQLRENYLKGLGTEDALRQLVIPWEDLERAERESNRAQASRIYRFLQANGYQLSPLADWDAAEKEIPELVIDEMAEMEHQLWCDWQRQQGQKTHPDLVPWEELPQEEREKNRHFVRGLPELFAEIGLQMDESGSGQ